MNFESINRQLRRQYLKLAGDSARRSAPRREALKLESLELREVPATLPAPVIDYTTTGAIGGTLNINQNTTFESGGTAAYVVNGAMAPVIMADPTNPNKLFGAVEMTTTNGNTRVGFMFSRDGGKTWTSPESRVLANGMDPNASSLFATPVPYSNVSNPSIAFDRFSNVFITYTEHNVGSTSGRLVLRKFSFGTPAAGVNEANLNTANSDRLGLANASSSGNEKVLYRWMNADAAYNPTVAVNTNLSEYVDGNTDATTDLATVALRRQTDPFAATQTSAVTTKVFVAWNTNDTTPINTGGNFINNTIRMTVAPDGGSTFGPSVLVNDDQHFNGFNDEYTAPKIVFTQGRAGLADSGGKMVTVFSSTVLRQLFSDTYDFSTDAATNKDANGDVTIEGPKTVAVTKVQTTAIREATLTTITLPNGSNFTFHTPQTTSYPIQVPVNDPTFRLDNLTVQLSLNYVDLSDLQIELVAPGDGDPATDANRKRITLVQSQVIDNQGNKNGNFGRTGTQLGRIKNDGLGNGFNVGTTFDDSAGRNINVNSTGLVDGFVASFRPETGTLAGVFGDMIAGAIGNTTFGTLNYDPNPGGANGAIPNPGPASWTVVITDKRSSGTGPLGYIGSVGIKMSQDFGKTGGAVHGSTLGNDKKIVQPNPFDPTTTGGVAAGPVTKVTANSFSGLGHPTGNNGNPNGVGTSLTVAADNSLGVYGQFQNRIYAAYYGGGTHVVYSDDAGLTWSQSTAIANAGFNPQIAVDPTTETVAVSSYSNAQDPSGRRSLTMLSTSVNGPAFNANGTLEFSAPAPVNPKDQTYDQLTGKTLDVEYVSSNGSQMGSEVYGNSTGLSVYKGKVTLVYAGNLDRNLAQLRTQQMTIADGPRVASSDSGVILGSSHVASTIPGDPAPIKFYNNPTATGGATFTGFYVEFDRPVMYSNTLADTVAIPDTFFKPNDIDLRYRAPGQDSNSVGARITGLTLVPLDEFKDPINGQLYGHKRFWVQVPQQTAAGTYSFMIGKLQTGAIPATVATAAANYDGAFGQTTATSISDRIRIQDPAANPSAIANQTSAGNAMDQNGNATPNENAIDAYSVPALANVTAPFKAAFQPQSLPIVIPGPHIVNSEIVQAGPASPFVTPSSNFIDVDMGTLIDSTTLLGKLDAAGNLVRTQENIVRITTPSGAVLNSPNVSVQPITDIGGDLATNDVAPIYSRYFRISFPKTTVLAPGNYQVTVGSFVDAFAALHDVLDPQGVPIAYGDFAARSSSPEHVVFDTKASFIDVKFDRQMDPTTLEWNDLLNPSPDILRLTGPAGDIPVTGMTIVSVDAMGGNEQPGVASRYFRIKFPQQVLPGSYQIQLGADISDLAGQKMDKDTNAGVDVLNGTPPGGVVVANGSPGGGVIPTSYGGTISQTIPADNLPHEVDLVINGGGDGYIPNKIVSTLSMAVDSSRTLRDLTVTLEAPNGKVMTLIFNAPRLGLTSSFSNVTFDDGAITPVQNGFANDGSNIPYETFGNTLLSDPFNLPTAAGTWKLRITNKGTLPATISKFALTLDKPVLLNGLGDPVADQSSLAFRLSLPDEFGTTGQKDWNPVGPAYNTAGGTTNGRVSNIAVDPSDPSGNTVYAAGASGGLWRTTNFLTRDAIGPTWAPLTDFGSNQVYRDVLGNITRYGSSINVGSLTVINETGDPSQTRIIVGTGSDALNVMSGAFNQRGDHLGTRDRYDGVGFLYSDDAGKTWNILDSTTNYAVPTGAPVGTPAGFLNEADVQRDHNFVGTVINKVVVERKIVPSANPNILYAAVGQGSSPVANMAGLWRSMDGGRTWAQIFRDASGNDVTDFAISEGSAQANTGYRPTVGYVAIKGVGVKWSNNLNATDPLGITFTTMAGGLGRPTINQNGVSASVPVAGPGGLPNGGKGRIVLATPSYVANKPLQNSYYQGWLVAAVAGAGGNFDGLYATKDFGNNWTKLRLTPTGGFSDGGGSIDISNIIGTDGGANQAISLTLDPTDPNILYVSSDDVYRVDMTQLNDPYKLQLYTHTDDSGQIQTNTSDANSSGTTGGGLVSTDLLHTPPLGSSTPVNDAYDSALAAGANRRKWNFLNLKFDPYTPTLKDTTLYTTNLNNFTNNGADVYWTSFGLTGTTFDQVSNLVTYVDPLTGKARVIYGHDNGIGTFVSDAPGLLINGANTSAKLNKQIGFTQDGQKLPGSTDLQVNTDRNGNMQVARFYSGDAQPSVTAALIAQAQLYGVARRQGDVYANSNLDVQTGNLGWGGVNRDGRASYVQTDPGGSGNVYILRRINEIFTATNPLTGLSDKTTDFFQVQVNGGAPISITNGLFQSAADAQGNGQWDDSVRRFAVNPIDPNGVLISSNLGRIFRLTNLQGNGNDWQDITTPFRASGTLDGTYAGALAFGAPPVGSSNTSTSLNAYVYAGTVGGKIFVMTGTSLAPSWKDISSGLDGSAIQKIVPSPVRGSNLAYAVTDKGVYQIQDWSSTDPFLNTWQKITGNLFDLTNNAFDIPDPLNPSQPGFVVESLQRLSTIAVDWRPLTFATPGTPILYVGGDSGVYRSLNNGTLWARFTDQSTNAVNPTGGLPNVKVTDLDLAIGKVLPDTGRNDVTPTDLPNLLIATTLGRGTWSINLITPNDIPTLNPILAPNGTNQFTIDEDQYTSSSPNIINLSGISAGTGEFSQNITITATSSDQSVIRDQDITISYNSPDAFGTLTYFTLPNANTPTTPVTITITVKDNGGLLGGGNDTLLVPFKVTVRPVNDQPTIDPFLPTQLPTPGQIVINEDPGVATLVPINGVSDGDGLTPGANGTPPQVITYTVTSSNTNLIASQTVPVTFVPGVTDNISFTPKLNQFGTARLTVTLNDHGGGLATNSKFFDVVVNPVNDVPSFTAGPDVYTDRSATPVQQSFPGWATNLSAGPSNESSQLLSFVVTVPPAQQALFSVLPTVSPSGTLTYTPAVNAVGSADVSVAIKDNGSNANGGVFQSAFQLFHILIGVNRAPVIDTNAAPELLPVGEGTTTSAGTLVSALIVDSNGSPIITDPDPGDLQGIAVSGLPLNDTVNRGTWQFSRDNGGTWTDFVTGPSTQTDLSTAARLLQPTDRIRFIPVTGFRGQATLQFHAWDQKFGTPGGTANLTPALTATGGATAYSTGIVTATARVATLLATIAEDTTSAGTDLKRITGNFVTDTDTAAKKGLAIIGTGGEIAGTWQFSINAGTSWTNFGVVGPDSARLLRDIDKVRFVPAANLSGEVYLKYRAWDQSTGTFGKTLNLTTLGPVNNTESVSATSDFLSIRVLPVNDRPVLDTAAAATLTPVDTIPAIEPAGDTVSSLLGSTVTDFDPGTVPGIAVTAFSKIGGTWEYNDGTGWTAFPSVSATLPFRLLPTDKIRFNDPSFIFSGTATISYKAWDQSLGGRGQSSLGSTTTAYSTGVKTATVLVGPGVAAPTANNAPSFVSATVALPDITEDSKPAGVSLTSIVNSVTVTDADPGALFGIAVTGIAGTATGAWQYSTNNGTTWLAITNVAPDNALLLKDTYKLRYLPALNYNGSGATITYRAWDQTRGTGGQRANLALPGATGGTTPISANSQTASLTVTPVNDPPVLNVAPKPALISVAPTADEFTTPGNLVSALLGTAVTDPDAGALQGIAVTKAAISSRGTWEFLLSSGGVWQPMPAVSTTNALFLQPADMIRFVPSGSFTGVETISYRAWDQTPGTTSVVATPGQTASTTVHKGSLSVAIESATVTIPNPAVNTRPVLNITPVVTLPNVAVRPTSGSPSSAGTDTASFLGTAVIDPDVSALSGIAVTFADTKNGLWQFSLDGANWSSLGGTSATSAIVLRSTDLVRFVPNPGFSGSTTIKYKAWDQSAGQAGSPVNSTLTTAFSTAVETATLSVNTSPVLVP